MVTFLADTNPLAILYALARENPTEVLVVFSEPPDTLEAEDVFFWQVEETGGGTPLTVVVASMLNSSNLLLTTSAPRDADRSYRLRRTADLHEQVDRGNFMPAGTGAPIALFESTLIQNNGAHFWRYDDSGSDLSTNWVRLNYDASGWLTGTDPFDAFRSPVVPPPGVSPTCRESLPNTPYRVRTCLMLSNAANTVQISTIYFRTHFTFDGDAAHSILRLRAVVDDGAVFYLNGAEIGRIGMPDGLITYNTMASRDVDNFEPEQLDVAAPTLVAGDNLLAVELHQAAAIIPDFTFSLKLSGVLPVKPPPRLTVGLVGGNLTVSWPPEAGILESADDPSGPWTEVLEAHSPGQYVTPAGEAKKFYRVFVP